MDIAIDKPAPDAAPKEESKVTAKAPPRWGRRLLLFTLAACAVGGGVFYFIHSLSFVSTDNATVQAHTTMLSAKVGGIIIRSDVEENQHVKAGTVLAEIRPDDYRHALAQTTGDLRTLRAQMAGAQRTFERIKALRSRGSATQEEYESAETQLEQVSAHAESVKAQVEQALLNLEYTKIVAPEDGTVGRRACEVGMLATPGQALMGFVADTERWVVANFKETDMNHVAIGQTAEVKVDLLSDRVFKGQVESISPSTGATFSLLPPDNATGNFTKVVQRVPVRVKLLDLARADLNRLGPGLSAEVEIKVR